MPVTENFSIDQHFYVPKSEADRIHRYTKYEDIFLGNHKQAFNPKINFNDGDDNLYITELVGQLISFTSADYLFGESITITCETKDDKFLEDDFYAANKTFETNLYEAGLSNSYFGDIVIELKVTDGKPIVMFHDPRLYMCVMDENNEPKQKILSFVIRKGEATYIYRRIHEVGTVTNKLYQISTSVDLKRTQYVASKDDNELKAVPLDRVYPGLVDVEITGVDEFLIRSVPNMRTMNSVYGMSDYIGKEPLMSSLNALTSFAHLIIEKNADPGMEVPEGTFNAEANVYNEDLKVFQTTAETKGIPRYISPDLSSLQQLFTQRDHVIEMISLYSEISLSLLGKEGNGGAIPDNYRAMKLRFYRTLQKMNRKKRYWEPALEWILTTSRKLVGQDEVNYTFAWSDGLPDDEQTELESMQLRKTIGIASNETLLEEWGKEYGWSEDRIKDEKARLLSQNPQNPTTEGASNLFSQTNKVDGTQPKS